MYLSLSKSFFEKSTYPKDSTYVLNVLYVLRIGNEYGRVNQTVNQSSQKIFGLSTLVQNQKSYVGSGYSFKPESVVTA